MTMKIAAFVMLLLLGSSIWVNTNDQDGWLWIGLYLLAALLTVDRVFPRAMAPLTWTLGGITLVWGVWLMIKVLAEGTFFHPVYKIGEEGREFLALFIVAGWMFALRRFGAGGTPAPGQES